ncbi:MAG: hypothetical protein ACI822_002940 [Gammaproteobacteria bacterium]|jgi:hypothetical protein
MNKLLSLAVSLLFFSTSASALDYGLGVKAGTVGIGLDISVSLTQTVNARLSLTNISIDAQTETVTVGDSGGQGDIDASLDFDFGANALLFDWYVFDGTFHLTAGMMKNNGKIDFSGNLVSGITVDGETLSPDDINGAIGGSISLGDSFQPYLGVGWGRKAGYDPGFSITADIGIALLDPKVELSAVVNTAGTNNLNQGALDERMAAVSRDAENDLSQLEAWPILAIGVNYAF